MAQRSEHVHLSDDYACIEVGDFEFYYGYEHTFCPKHGADQDACDDADCEDYEWAFVVTHKGEEIERFVPKGDGCEPEEWLLIGITQMKSVELRKKK